MGNTDSIPIISQTKSLVQFLCKDEAGALETQINFSKGCPVVAQVRSLIEHSNGDDKSALETQLIFVDGVNKFTDGIPLVGHAKGLVYYLIVKDNEAGDRAMKSSSRTVGVIGGAAVGAVTGGPVGAVAGGVVAGIAMDGLITKADTMAHNGEFRPHGYIAAIQAIQSNSSESKSGVVFDIAVGIASDGVVGLSAARASLVERPIIFYASRAPIDRNHATNASDPNHTANRNEDLDYLSGEESRRFVFIHTDGGGLEVQLPADASAGDSPNADMEDEEERYFAALRHFPDAFFCPITTELMTDPMVCSDGHTYERHAIESWLATRSTSPLTNVSLRSLDLVPNHALRNLISTFSEARGMEGLPEFYERVPKRQS